MATHADTRERLVEAARDLFLFQGYNATGISQILQKAGVNSGSLYYYFPTKEDLLLAVLQWYLDNIYEGLLQPVYDRVDDPVERIFGVLDGYRQVLQLTNFQYGCPIGNLALELANSHPKALQSIEANFSNWRDVMAESIRAASGRFPEGVDPDKLATHTLAVMEGAVMLAKTQKRIEPFDDAISHLRDYYERLMSDGTSWATPSR